MPYPFPYKKWTSLKVAATGEEVWAAADELDGVVAVRTHKEDVVLMRHADLMPTSMPRTAESYDRTTVE